MQLASKSEFCNEGQQIYDVFAMPYIHACKTMDFIIGSKSLSCKYSMGQNNLRAFGYNSAESEPIWMKSGIM